MLSKKRKVTRKALRLEIRKTLFSLEINALPSNDNGDTGETPRTGDETAETRLENSELSFVIKMSLKLSLINNLRVIGVRKLSKYVEKRSKSIEFRLKLTQK